MVNNLTAGLMSLETVKKSYIPWSIICYRTMDGWIQDCKFGNVSCVDNTLYSVDTVLQGMGIIRNGGPDPFRDFLDWSADKHLNWTLAGDYQEGNGGQSVLYDFEVAGEDGIVEITNGNLETVINKCFDLVKGWF